MIDREKEKKKSREQKIDGFKDVDVIVNANLPWLWLLQVVYECVVFPNPLCEEMFVGKRRVKMIRKTVNQKNEKDKWRTVNFYFHI